MYSLTSSFKFAFTLLIFALLLPGCGGSNNDSEANDSVIVIPGDDDTTDPGDTPPDQEPADPGDTPTDPEPTVQKVSDIRTLAYHGTPTMVFNSAGDGIAVWTVASKGFWLYYSHYDHASGSWSQAEKLTTVNSGVLRTDEPKLVSSSAGFAAAWKDRDANLFVSLFHDGEWVTKQVEGDDFGNYWDFNLVSNGRGYLLTRVSYYGNKLYALVSKDGISWEDATNLYFSDNKTLNYSGVASNGAGYLVIFGENNTNSLFGKLFDGSTWQDIGRILGPTDGYNSQAQVLIASNGEGYSLVWLNSWGGSRVWNRIYTPSDGWSSKRMVAYKAETIEGITSNGTGYCVVISMDSDSRLDVIVDPQGDGNWDSVQTLAAAVSIQQTSLVTDGEGYALAWNVYNDVEEEVGSFSYYASIYQNGEWSSTSDPLLTGTFVDAEFSNYLSTPITFIGWNEEYILALKQKVDGAYSITTIQHENTDGWSEIDVLEDDSGLVTNPAIAANPQEGISVIWHQFGDNGSEIATYRNQRLDKQWQGKQLISEGNYWLGSSYDTNLIAANNGSTLAVWSQDRSGYQALFANIRIGDRWQQAVILSDSITETPPQIATNGTGFTISWEEQASDESYRLQVLSFNVDDWSESVVQDISLLHQSTEPIHKALASNGDSYMLLYADFISSGLVNLRASLFDGASWSEPATISESATHRYGCLQIESNGSSYLSAWFQSGTEGMNIYSAEFDGVSWNPRQVVATDLRPDLGSVFSEVLQLESNGTDYAIFWIDMGKINSSFYTDEWSEAVAIGNIDEQYLGDGEVPAVVSNGNGYAVAWVLEDYPRSILVANIYDGTAWRGVEDLSQTSEGYVEFDMTDSSNMIKASDEKYAVTWEYFNGNFEIANHLYARVFDGTNWSDSSSLSVNSEYTDIQLASDGEGFMVAWLQDNDPYTDQKKIFKSSFSGSEWSSGEVVDENSISKYDLTLLGGVNGYQAIWTRAELGGEPWVRMPWAISGL